MTDIGMRLSLDTGDFVSGAGRAREAITALSAAMERAEREGRTEDYGKLAYERDRLRPGVERFERDTRGAAEDTRLQGSDGTTLRNRFNAIDQALRDGDVGEREKGFTAYLMEAASSVRNNTRRSLTKPPVQVEQRIEAVELLSRLGSKELIPFLVDLFSHDPEPLVKAAAARAIGRVGVDPEGLALGAFSRAVMVSGQAMNEQLLIAVAVSVGALCRFSGPPVSGAGAALLIALAGPDKPARARNQALQEIASLSTPPAAP